MPFTREGIASASCLVSLPCRRRCCITACCLIESIIYFRVAVWTRWLSAIPIAVRISGAGHVGFYSIFKGRQLVEKGPDPVVEDLPWRRQFERKSANQLHAQVRLQLADLVTHGRLLDPVRHPLGAGREASERGDVVENFQVVSVQNGMSSSSSVGSAAGAGAPGSSTGGGRSGGPPGRPGGLES